MRELERVRLAPADAPRATAQSDGVSLQATRRHRATRTSGGDSAAESRGGAGHAAVKVEEGDGPGRHHRIRHRRSRRCNCEGYALRLRGDLVGAHWPCWQAGWAGKGGGGAGGAGPEDACARDGCVATHAQTLQRRRALQAHGDGHGARLRAAAEVGGDGERAAGGGVVVGEQRGVEDVRGPCQPGAAAAAARAVAAQRAAVQRQQRGGGGARESDTAAVGGSAVARDAHSLMYRLRSALERHAAAAAASRVAGQGAQGERGAAALQRNTGAVARRNVALHRAPDQRHGRSGGAGGDGAVGGGRLRAEEGRQCAFGAAAEQGAHVDAAAKGARVVAADHRASQGRVAAGERQQPGCVMRAGESGARERQPEVQSIRLAPPEPAELPKNLPLAVKLQPLPTKTAPPRPTARLPAWVEPPRTKTLAATAVVELPQ